EELAACTGLQKRIWGYSDLDVYPLRLFVNLGKIGGHVLGAFAPAGKLVGFVAAMPAWHDDRRYLYSLSLGVLPGHENRGLGKALKLAQRRVARQAGIDVIEWTFDPLQARNAHFNIVRLGAIARRYLADHYGPVASRLQHRRPSDRLVAEWWLNSPRVRRALSGRQPRAAANVPAAQVSIPLSIASLAKANPRRAREEQARVGKQLRQCFARGLAITGFTLNERSGAYHLGLLRETGIPRGV
ncbi:MAG: GNAT family N-acetyltransferase, partial [Acidobacteria bacterium]|nr:GNAT family N-acetyltransferase [Acidobacteriota bacterium]